MKKTTLFCALLAVAFLSAAIIGCDNRSQMEKDMDKAADNVEKAATDTQKQLGL